MIWFIGLVDELSFMLVCLFVLKIAIIADIPGMKLFMKYHPN